MPYYVPHASTLCPVLYPCCHTHCTTSPRPCHYPPLPYTYNVTTKARACPSPCLYSYPIRYMYSTPLPYTPPHNPTIYGTSYTYPPHTPIVYTPHTCHIHTVRARPCPDREVSELCRIIGNNIDKGGVTMYCELCENGRIKRGKRFHCYVCSILISRGYKK